MMIKPVLMILVLASAMCAATDTRSATPEPFNLTKVVVAGGQTWPEWEKLMANVQAAKRELEQCRQEPDQCNEAEQRFTTLVTAAASRQGRSRIELVNEKINGYVRYLPDEAQSGKADSWSLPVDASEQGSVNKRVGDCEDFVLAKYAALHQAGVPDDDLRMVLVYDSVAREDHAVLAVLEGDKWLILDNRWNKVVEDKELWQFKPKYVVEKSGVRLLAKEFRLSDIVTVAPKPATSGTVPTSPKR